MQFEKIFKAYKLAERAYDAEFEAVVAAEDAGLHFDHFTGENNMVQIERLALAAMKAASLTGEDAARRDATFALVAVDGNHSDIVPMAELDKA